MNTSEPWRRKPGETAKAYAAFCIYRDLGPSRSLSAVAQAYVGSISLMRRWSARWSWVRRAEAWDEHVDEQARTAFVEARIENRKARIAACTLLLERIRGAIEHCKPEGTLAVRTYSRENGDEVTETYVVIPPWTPHEMIRGLQVSTQELRKDYDDEPARREADKPRDDGAFRDFADALREMREDADVRAQFAEWDKELLDNDDDLGVDMKSIRP